MSSAEAGMPLFVDMDETLVKTDIAQELLVQSFRSWSTIKRLLSTGWSGRSHIKRVLAKECEFSAENLPLNEGVLDYLKAEKEKGRHIVLATASDEFIANKVAASIGIFDDVIASSPGNNLKGENKARAIKAYCDNGAFEYLGDSDADIKIWKDAEVCGFVNPTKKAQAFSKTARNISVNIQNKESWARALIKAMRPHQWAKNALIFLPLIFSHNYFDISSILSACIVFFLFSFIASGNYLINDLLDIEADRAHATKWKRPFAAATLSPKTGVMIGAFLIFASLGAAVFLVSAKVAFILIGYFVVTNLYSFVLKGYSTIDVITLTCLYTVRILVGAAAINAVMSPWLINFSLFFFLSLAYMKRYIELSVAGKKNKELSGRNYTVDEMDTVKTFGIANGGLSILTLTLYLNSDYVVDSYASPQLLWFICPIVMFWIYRAWMWATRDQIDDDPVVFALKDKMSFITVAIAGAVLIASKYIDLTFFNTYS
jgi:4-hydroxybenzoate polyprenyltransferase